MNLATHFAAGPKRADDPNAVVWGVSLDVPLSRAEAFRER